MDIKEIKNILDDRFNIKNIPSDLPFSKLLPIIYDKAGINFRNYFTKDFLIYFHGLMIKNSEYADKVYLTVFLSREILDKIFLRNENNVLIFSHHPMEMETSNRGFLPLPEKYFQEMKKRNISVYVLHTPLDIHPSISTSQSIADKLNLKNSQKYSPNSIGYSGVYGDLPEKYNFEDFIELLKKIFNLKEIHFIKRFNTAYKIGIIAGGGAEVEYIKETIGLGCDTYLSGDYENKIRNEYSLEKRKEFDKIKDRLNINLIECSHYATEKVAILNEIKDIFEDFGFTTVFIEQDNAWY